MYRQRCVPISTHRGDTFRRTITITGYPLRIDTVIAAQVRAMTDFETAPVLEFSTAAGSIQIDLQDGKNYITLEKSAAEMRVNAGIYAYDIQFSQDGDTFTLLAGTFTITQDITQ